MKFNLSRFYLLSSLFITYVFFLFSTSVVAQEKDKPKVDVDLAPCQEFKGFFDFYWQDETGSWTTPFDFWVHIQIDRVIIITDALCDLQTVCPLL